MKKVISLLLVTAMMLSSFAFSFSVVAETTGLTFANCTDANGNLLNAQNLDNKEWKYQNGELYLGNGQGDGTILFDNEVNANIIEFHYHSTLARGWTPKGEDGVTEVPNYQESYRGRNGIVFRYTNEQNYYFLYISYVNAVNLIKVSNGVASTISAASGTIELDDTTSQGGRNIDIQKNGVTLTVSWNDSGKITVYVNNDANNPIVFNDITNPLTTGNYYGLRMHERYDSTGNVDTGSRAYITSFTVGAKSTNFANFKDTDGNLLDAYTIEGSAYLPGRAWSYVDENVGTRSSWPWARFMLFDNELNQNRIEASFNIPPLDNGNITQTKIGLVFALTEYDKDMNISPAKADTTYYILCLEADNTISIHKNNNGYTQLAHHNVAIDTTKDVVLTAEWDNGNIKGYVNGKLVITATDDYPLTGKYYGFYMDREWWSDHSNDVISNTSVRYFTAGLPTFDNCKDGNENQLDTYYVNSANAWTYESGKLDISTSATEALLLFDNPLNQNIIETEFYTPNNIKSGGVKEGIAFAYDETTNSYYWLYVDYELNLCLAKIVNGTQDGLLLRQSVENILKDSEANNIIVTWNETTGAISISFNGNNYSAADTSALTGDLYGLLVKNTSGTDSGSYFTSFKAGTETTIIATPGLPEKIGHSTGTTFNASITADVWNESDNYKAIEMVVTIPEKVTVTNVTAGNRLNGGQLSWKQDGTTLRISYLSTTYDNITITPNSELKAELFNIEFCVEDDLTVGETVTVTLVEAELALKSDTSAPDYNVNILPAEENDRTASAVIVEGTTFTVKDLYTGAGFDVIPADKKAVLVTVTKPENTSELTYNDGTTTVIFKYNAEISAKLSTDGSIIAYVALVDVNTTIEATGKNFTFGNTASNLVLGDVNSDGVVNAEDALAVINMWLRADTEITDDKILAANVNGDGNIDTYDALGIVENFVKDFDYVIITKAVAINN